MFSPFSLTEKASLIKMCTCPPSIVAACCISRSRLSEVIWVVVITCYNSSSSTRPFNIRMSHKTLHKMSLAHVPSTNMDPSPVTPATSRSQQKIQRTPRENTQPTNRRTAQQAQQTHHPSISPTHHDLQHTSSHDDRVSVCAMTAICSKLQQITGGGSCPRKELPVVHKAHHALGKLHTHPPSACMPRLHA